MSRALSLLLLLSLTGAAHAQAPAEPLVKQVKARIHKGVSYLLAKRQADGSWENLTGDEKSVYHGGSTALAVLALLHCDGALLDDPQLDKQRLQAISAGIDHLAKIQSSKVYVRALQTMAFAEAKQQMPIVKANVQWLLEARVYKDRQFIGWEYENRATNMASDASNSQYAMLALWYARQAGVVIDRKVWEEIHDYYQRSQRQDGSWTYSTEYGPENEINRPSQTMTVAGLCGLYIAGMEINGGREQGLKNGTFSKCGRYGDEAAINKGLTWFNKNFAIDLPQRAYYHLYGIERAGRLSGLRFFGEHDWYREGCEFLVKKQEADGSWATRGGWDRWPHVNTSFALLFLSKGRTPIVISKLVHGNWPRREDETDWNNDRNDLRNLTEYVAKTDVFDKKAVSWQTYDIARALYARSGNREPNAVDQSAIVADMKQSPILYITGHDAPEFQGSEITLIKRYVENGGFLFAEACCGSAKFDAAIKAWVEEHWPGSKLEYVEGTHPVWSCFNVINPGEPFKLMKLDVGCRTVMLYSPQDLSCHWESNRTKDGVSQRAFELGANLLAYGTGRVAPQPRLTPVEIADAPKEQPRPSKNDYFQVSQIYHQGDWQPAPRAMTNLLEHVHKTSGLSVYLKTDRLLLSDKSDVARAKFLYMHGRKDFRVDPDHLKYLRFTLETGGLLFADACCGNPAFDKSFRAFAQALYPERKLTPVATDPKTRDRLFGSDFNKDKEPLTKANIQIRTERNGKMVPSEPQLEGIQINGRWVVIYSKYDIGCALERSTSADCIGYDPDSAFKIATAVVLYNARP
jgi:hypothetical protein